MIAPGASTFEGQTPMIRFLFALQLLLLTFIAAPHAFAQNRGDGDQPGFVPTESDEQLDPKWQRTVVFYRTTEPPGTIIVNTNERFLYVVQPRRAGAALRHRRRPRRLPVAGPGEDHPQEGMAGLDAAGGNDRAPALSAALDGRRPRQSARRARALSRQHGLSHPRHQPAADHRHRGVVGLLPSDQSGRDRSLRSGSGRHQGDHPAAAEVWLKRAGGACGMAQLFRVEFPHRSDRSAASSPLAVAVAGRHLRALRHQDAEAHGAPRRRVLRRQHRPAGLLAEKTTRATGRASTSISAAPSRRRSSTTRRR